ncbi:tetratricopeptide repeat protein [Vibrio renipiscarius]|uniref:TPR repeats containing protein n=1 Tax=Vibrio renipiscarius TaxID=1461322 RepID=A0A0C2NVN2_9VIBR|nr:hypothetical protein [Vibrio renipiscarius]KII76261.1 TPR repeats containing protein [Vibrio renipiscarius]KII78217.1 TPR repeats containing protein [Vibrio renipiscarius]
MDKSQHLLEIELEKLKLRIESEPEQVLSSAERCATKASQIFYPQGVIRSLIIMSRCYWALMDYRKGLKTIREAYTKLTLVENDDDLPEILHIHALQFWGQAKYYSAQQYWIQSLEKSALVDQVETQIESLIGLGNVWRALGEYELAQSTHELAVKVSNSMCIPWLEGKARILLAWDQYLAGHYIDMLSVLDGAEEVLQHHDDKTWQAEIWDFRGLALLGLKRLDDAEKATQHAQQLVEEHNLMWMKAHSYISRARLELLRQQPAQSAALLRTAEKAAKSFDNGELLSQIYFQQSRVAEEVGDYKVALQTFKQYRRHAGEMLRVQTSREGNDKARTSKRLLELRAKKLIHRIHHQFANDANKQMNKMVSETHWWEQMMLYKMALSSANHSVIVIHHSNQQGIEICAELAHSFCNNNDLLTRLSPNKLGLLLAETASNAEHIHGILKQMLDMYPWQRRGILNDQPRVDLYNILAFPFTLEQLELTEMTETS